jgi:streptogramin lyase
MRPFSRSLSGLALLLGLAETLPGQAITEFPIPTSGPIDITAGPDGNLWFTLTDADQIGRITTGGVVTEFPIPGGPFFITVGPDGNLWFTQSGVKPIGRITPAGVVTEFPIPTLPNLLFDITAGPDGNLWFIETGANQIGRVTPAGAVTEFPIPAGAGSNPQRVTAGPDGNLWFTENGANQIGRITPVGVVSEFPIPTAASGPVGITAGPDGNLWFTEFDANQIGRISTTGVVTEFPIPTAGSNPIAITAGPDGNLWFTELAAQKIGRITTAGVITEFPIPTPPSASNSITAGPDGSLWFTQNSQIGRITTGPTAQSMPLGEEFQVNTYTPAAQLRSAVASSPAGDFFVVWESGPGPSMYIRGRSFDATGAPAGAEFPIGSAPGSRPEVAASTSGFVVAWNDTATETIVAQRFDPSGAPQGTEFQVSSSTADLQQDDPQIAMGADGDFVIVWTAFDDEEEDNVFGRRFDAAGTPLGADFQVSTATESFEVSSDVALDASGAFVVVWEHETFDGFRYAYARLYDGAGTVLGSPFLLTGEQGECPSVGRDAGGAFVATWINLADNANNEVLVRRFDAGANPLAPAFQVNTFATDTEGCPRIAMGGSGGFVVTWASERRDEPGINKDGVFAQRYDSGGRRLGAEFQVNTYTTDNQYGPSVAIDDRDGFVVTWHSLHQDGSGFGIFGKRGGFPDARLMKVDERASGGASDVNGVLESGERVTVDPAWLNASSFPQPLSSAVSNLTGPGGPLYTLHDASADYGTIAPGATNDCFTATADCLEVTVSGPRSVSHWDATFHEALSAPVSKSWALHVGESFFDVPRTYPFYRHIETLFHNLVTVGCGGTAYCPATGVNRQQMAVFLLRSKYGLHFVPPPATGTVFPDVPLSNPFAAWIELLAAEGITAGCGGGNYCPTSTVTRRQMAVFLLKSKLGSSHVPPVATGIFDDVPVSDPAAPWIEELYGLGITGGCSTAPLLFCPGSTVTRGQMAAFLVKTFSLALYGP